MMSLAYRMLTAMGEIRTSLRSVDRNRIRMADQISPLLLPL